MKIFEKMVYMLILTIITIGMFELSYTQLRDMAIDPSQNFTLSYRNTLSNIYNYRFLVYLGIIVFNGVFTFAPLKEITLEEETEDTEIKPKKQTYLEYVQERLAVERMME